MLQKEKNRKIFTIVFIAVLTLIPLSLCFNNNVWLDEAFSMRWSMLPFPKMMRRLIGDVHPPLYYFLLRIVLKLTGNSLFAAKILSVLALFLCFLVGATFVKKTFGYKAMIFFNLFMLCTPMMLKKSVEVRMYTWSYLFVIISAIEMYYLLGDNHTKKNWIVFTISSLAAAYTHYFALIAMVFIYGAMLLFYLFTKNWKQVRAWIVCSLVTIVVYLPWVPVAINQVNGGVASWITMPTSRLQLVRELFETDIQQTSNLYIFLMAIFIIYGGILFLKYRTSEIYWAVACMSILWMELIFGLVFGMMVRPVMAARYLMIPLCVTILGMSCVCKYIPKYLLCIPLLLFIITGFRVYPKVYAEEYDTLTDATLQFADDNIRDGDIILYDEGGLCSVIPYYFPNMSPAFEQNFDVYNDDYEYLWYFDAYQLLDYNKLRDNNKNAIDYGHYGLDNVNFTIYYIYHLGE